MRASIRASAAVLLLGGIVQSGAARAAGVSVLYAGSLANLMEHGLGAAFDSSTGDRFVGFAGGSKALANQIKGSLRRADVFISATPKVNDTLMGDANGNWVTWYVTFAKSPLLIAYNPYSRFAAELKTKPWYEVLREPGIRIGRTDPALDPKGRLTLLLLQRAEQVYHRPGLAQAVLGTPGNPAQVRPEESLTGRMQSGQFDVGFFYSTEVTDLKLPAIHPAAEVATGANYTVTILRDAADPDGAARYVNFLLGAQGQAIMHRHGLDTVAPVLVGDKAAVPATVQVR